jgi:TrmH family RNA methyltransferase
MIIPRLTSKDNPLLKTFRLVASGARRAPELLVLAEGIRVLEEVERAGCVVEAVVMAENFGGDTREENLLRQWQARKLHVCKTSRRLLQFISSVQTPQGAVGLVRVHECKLPSVSLPPSPLILFACGIQDPGNLGTLIRTAAAAGVHLVCTSKGTVSARNPKVIRSSAGAFFRLPIVEHRSASEFVHFCEHHSIQLYRTHARDGVVYTAAELRSGCAIVLGNEGSGVEETAFSGFPALRIPMAEDVESLNVAVAGAVILFEASQQRRNAQADMEGV